jgi:DNA-binding LacI/PurR family transcriptional regulator
MPTIKEIAKRSGFSASTVSYALRDNPRIPKKTRKRIQAVAEELGYQRDAHLGQLMSYLKRHRRGASACPITWINSTTDPEHWHRTPWAREFYQSAKQRSEELGFALSEIWVHDPKIPESRIDDILKARGTQGLILSTPLQNETWTQWIDWNSYATVIVDDPFAMPQFDRVFADYAANMRKAIEQAFARGYERPKVWLTEHEDYWTGYGYTYECLRQNRLRPELDTLLPPFESEASPERVKQWMETHQPDAVIAPTATVGIQLKELGYKIPEDLGYIAMYVLNNDSEWSGFSQQHTQQSIVAVDRIATLLQNNTPGHQTHPLQIQIRGEWHEGTTLRPPSFFPVRSKR